MTPFPLLSMDMLLHTAHPHHSSGLSSHSLYRAGVYMQAVVLATGVKIACF
jgi:hypothetical protein